MVNIIIYIYTRVISHVCNITASILYIHDKHIDIIALYERVDMDTFKYAHYTNRLLLVHKNIILTCLDIHI